MSDSFPVMAFVSLRSAGGLLKTVPVPRAHAPPPSLDALTAKYSSLPRSSHKLTPSQAARLRHLPIPSDRSCVCDQCKPCHYCPHSTTTEYRITRSKWLGVKSFTIFKPTLPPRASKHLRHQRPTARRAARTPQHHASIRTSPHADRARRAASAAASAAGRLETLHGARASAPHMPRRAVSRAPHLPPPRTCTAQAQDRISPRASRGAPSPAQAHAALAAAGATRPLRAGRSQRNDSRVEYASCMMHLMLHSRIALDARGAYCMLSFF